MLDAAYTRVSTWRQVAVVLCSHELTINQQS